MGGMGAMGKTEGKGQAAPRSTDGAMGSMGGSGKTEMAGMRDKPSKTPVAATSRPLGQPLPLDWADYLTVMGHHQFIAQTGERATFDAGGIDVFAAGPLDRNWSGLANPVFDTQNGGASVDQAYGQFISHWSDRFQSARFGQTLPFAILLNQGGPSMTLSTPVVLAMSADTGTSWTPATLMRGLEIGAVNLPRWNVYLGAGQPHLEAPPTGSERNTDVYASTEYLLGQNGNSVTLYGYSGRARLPESAADRNFHRIGVFVNAYWPRSTEAAGMDYAPKTKAVLGYLAGRDKDDNNDSLKSSGYFLLGEHLLSDRLAAYARYDHARQDLTAGGSQTTRGPALGASWWAQTQVRFTVEAQLLKTTGQRDNKVLMTEFMWVL